MAVGEWWQRPTLRTDEDEHKERRVSWLELFYDLVFVVVIAEVSHYLSQHLTGPGIFGYILLFTAVWWVWIGGTFYTERFETQDLSYRLLTFLQMLPVAAMAVFAHDGTGDTSVGFALAYAAARIIITFIWLRGGWYTPPIRPTTNRYGQGFSLSILLWLTSIFVPIPYRFVLWALGLLIDLVTPITTLRLQAKLPRLSTSRLPERFGLFVIIVLGETIVGVVQGVADQEPFRLGSGVVGVLGMALAFCIWWLYFDFVARRPPRRGLWWGLVWNYLHLPLVMAIAAIGAAILNIISSDEPALMPSLSWLLAGSVSITLIAVALIELALRRDGDEPTDPRVSPALKFGASIIALALGAVGSSLGTLPLLLGLLGLLLVQMGYGAYVWFTQDNKFGRVDYEAG